MRFLPKSRSHDSDGSVASDSCGSVSGTSGGTARARIARYGARQTHSQSSPTHRDHAPDPPTREWSGLRDEDEDADDVDDDVDVDRQQQQQQHSSRLLVCFDDTDLKDTRV